LTDAYSTSDSEEYNPDYSNRNSGRKENSFRKCRLYSKTDFKPIDYESMQNSCLSELFPKKYY
jgi:hypothetical protein